MPCWAFWAPANMYWRFMITNVAMEGFDSSMNSFSLQYWHEQGFLLSLKWNLVQSSRFQCPHCKSKFSQKHNLKRHVKQKPEENVPLLEDFKCKLCSKVFSTKDILLNHEESVHTVHEFVMLNRKAKSPTPVSQHYPILLATHCRLWTYQQLYTRTFSVPLFGKLTTNQTWGWRLVPHPYLILCLFIFDY